MSFHAFCKDAVTSSLVYLTMMHFHEQMYYHKNEKGYSSVLQVRFTSWKIIILHNLVMFIVPKLTFVILQIKIQMNL